MGSKISSNSAVDLSKSYENEKEISDSDIMKKYKDLDKKIDQVLTKIKNKKNGR